MSTIAGEAQNHLSRASPSKKDDPGVAAVTAYHYDVLGNLERIEHGNGTATHYRYDGDNRLVEVETVGVSDGLLLYATCVYDALGRRSEIQRQINGQSIQEYFTYDPVHRLSEERYETENALSVITHNYDAVGNRVETTRDGQHTAYTYDANDRLVDFTTHGVTRTFSYDANGNTYLKFADRFKEVPDLSKIKTAVDFIVIEENNRLKLDNLTHLKDSIKTFFDADLR